MNHQANVPSTEIEFDQDGTSVIKGTRIKFTNSAEWITADGEVIPPDRELIVVSYIRVCQKWLDGTPKTRTLGVCEAFPDVERLNDDAPRSEWREAFGKTTGPWQNAYIVYFFDPKTMLAYTFPTATTGGFKAVRELTEAMNMAQRMRGDNAYPLVTLTEAHMPTQFGGRQRPCIKIKKFILLAERGGNGITGPKDAPLLEEPSPKKDAKVGNADLDDEIPW